VTNPTRSFAFCALLLLFGGCVSSPTSPSTGGPLPNRPAVLSDLSNEINSHYGFRGGPRINLGPCGRFARDFREQWNARFADPVNIAFVMAADGVECHHVLVKFRDGTYYDGGNGIMSAEKIAGFYPGSHIDEMVSFDYALLDKRSYSLKRDYSLCPNYSDELTNQIIRKHLARIPSNLRN
jgi:hypothetical protein